MNTAETLKEITPEFAVLIMEAYSKGDAASMATTLDGWITYLKVVENIKEREVDLDGAQVPAEEVA